MRRRNFLLTSLSALLAPLVKWGPVQKHEMVRWLERTYPILQDKIVEWRMDIDAHNWVNVLTRQGLWSVPGPHHPMAAKPQGEA